MLNAGSLPTAHTKNSGFTLIELLVTVAIVGILASIAIPQFSTYRARASDSRSTSDLRNGISAMEAYYTDMSSYISCADAASCTVLLPGFQASTGVSISFTDTSAGNIASFVGESCHTNGSTSFDYDSSSNLVSRAAKDC